MLIGQLLTLFKGYFASNRSENTSPVSKINFISNDNQFDFIARITLNLAVPFADAFKGLAIGHIEYQDSSDRSTLYDIITLDNMIL